MMEAKRFIADPSPWMPITHPLTLKVLGKFAEELFECTDVVADLDSSDEQVANEIADVLCNSRLVGDLLGIVADRVDLEAPGGDVDEYDLLAAIGRCGAAAARCIIQGIDGAEPSTGRINRDWLIDEMAAMRRVIGRYVKEFDLDAAAIKQRMEFKRAHLLRWHQMEARG